MMADTDEKINEYIEKSLNYLSAIGRPIDLKYEQRILGRCEASWGEPERDMTVSTRLSDSVFTETHRLENALKSEDE